VADRTVTTNLVLRVRDYVTPARAAKAETSKVTEAVVGASKASDRLGAAAGRAGRATDALGGELSETGRAARKLDGDIGDLEREILKLKVAMAGVDGDAFKQMDRQLRGLEGSLRRRLNVRKAFEDAGDDGADALALSFSQRIGPLLARAPLSPPILAAIAAGAPAIGAAASAAILGGLSAATVAAGVKVALTDPRVAKEAESTGKFLGDQLRMAVEDNFTPATVNAMRQLRREVVGLRPELERLGDAGAAFVAPLTRGATGLAREAIPGVTRAVEESGAVVRQLERSMSILGRAGGQAMDTIGDGAAGAALAVADLTTAAAAGITASAQGLKLLSTAYTYIKGVTAIDKTKFAAELAAGQAAGAGFQAELEALKVSLGDAGAAADGAAGDVADLNAALRSFETIQLTANDAERGFQEAVDNAREAFDGKVKALDLATPKGRAYSQALDDIATSAAASAQSIFDLTGDQAAANAKIEEGRAALIRQAEKYGLTRQAAIDYANKVLAIPKQWTTDVKAETRAAARHLAEIKAAIAAIKDKTVRVRTIYVESGRVSSQGERVIGDGTSTKYSRGGVVHGPGPRGVDSVRAILAPGEGVLTVRGLEALGGSSALAALNRGAPAPTYSRPMVAPPPRWVGAAGGGGGQTVTLRLIQQTPDGRVIREQLIDYATRTNVAPVNLWPTS
jgi:hypothetical protein